MSPIESMEKNTNKHPPPKKTLITIKTTIPLITINHHYTIGIVKPFKSFKIITSYYYTKVSSLGIQQIDS